MNISLVNSERRGYIFLCSDATENECLEKQLLGGTADYVGLENLKKGDTVFLYNFNQKRLFGPFIATSSVQNNIDSEAWGGEYPQQVRFNKTKSFLPLYRDQLVDVLKFNRKGFPVVKVTAAQIEQLEKLFQAKKRAKNYDDSASIPTKNGFRVRSKGEEQIADWLFKHRIACAFEYAIPKSTKRCDFYIPLKDDPGIYIEFWGLNDENYLLNMKIKQAIYKKQNLTLIEIFPTDLRKLDAYLYNKLSPFFPEL